MTLAGETSTVTPRTRGDGRRHEGRRQRGRAGDGRQGGASSGLITAVLVALVLALGLLALPGLLGYGMLVVRSGSMADTAPVGSLVVARPLDTRDVRVGDVILVRRAGATAAAPVLHRVISLTDRAGEVVVRTKGDSNAAADPTPYLLRGTTMTPVLAVPHVGRGFAFVHTPLGWLVVIAIPATLLLLVQLRTIWCPPRRRAAHRTRAIRFPRVRLAAHRSRAGWYSPPGNTDPQMANDHAPAPA